MPGSFANQPIRAPEERHEDQAPIWIATISEIPNTARVNGSVTAIREAI